LEGSTIRARFSIAALLLLALAFVVGLAKWSHETNREAEIAHAVKLIATLDEEESGPIGLIRAVNHLHNLGHSDAIESLRRVANSHPLDDLNGQTKILNFDVLIPLLFVSRDAGAKLPSPDWDRKNWQASKNNYLLDRDIWKLPVELSQDIPFDTEWRFVMSTGIRFQKTYLIEWADRDGRLRDFQLVPSDDPFNAVANAIRNLLKIEMSTSDQTEEELRFNIENHMYQQVFAMVSHLVPEVVAPKWNDWSGNKRDLENLATICKTRGLYWNRHAQQYSFANDAE